MARPGLMRHRKFARLERLLGSRLVARGVLELLWDVAYEAGDDLLGSAEDVEWQAGWTGEQGALAAALVDAGFIDRDGEQFRVHDLYDHAPDYVRRRLARENQRKANGSHASPLTNQRPVSDRTLTPTPAPTPVPTNERTSEAEILTRKDWETGKDAICKLANSCGSRLWPPGGDKRPKPADRHLVLKAAALAVAAPCKPYSVAWLESAIEAGLGTRRMSGLRNPGAYLHKVLSRAAESDGRNFNADLAAATVAIPEKVFQCGDPK